MCQESDGRWLSSFWTFMPIYCNAKALTWLLSNEMVQTQKVGLENENSLRGLSHWTPVVRRTLMLKHKEALLSLWRALVSEIQLITKRPNQCL